LHLYDRSSGAPEYPGHIFVTDPAGHTRQSHLAMNTDFAIMSSCVNILDMGSHLHGKAAALTGVSLKVWHTLDPHPREQEAETVLGDCWLKCSFCCWGFSGL
jgi:hypothetical protein